MKRKLVLGVLSVGIFGLANAAGATELSCRVQDAGATVFERTIAVEAGSKTALGEHGDFRIEVNSPEPGTFEIEVLDLGVPSRTYARGRLLAEKDTLQWSVWSRVAMIDVTCRLAR